MKTVELESFTVKLYQEMEYEIQKIAQTADCEIRKAEQSFHISETHLLRLREFVYAYQFRDSTEEILFFKELKPKIHAELIFYAELLHIETNKPLATKKLVISYYRQVIQRLQIYFERRNLHYLYYRSKRTVEDHMLFLRASDCVPIIPEDSLDLDRAFSTIGSSWFAKFIGFEKMVNYLLNQIEHLKYGPVQIQPERKSNTIWTDSKAALVELAYALHARGSLNHGKAEIKDIVSELEYIFNIHVGNFYRTYLDITIRKKNRTPFIDSMKETLERRMDEGLG